MSFFKKITKGAGKFLSKVGDVSGKILGGGIGKATGILDKATGGLLGAALISNPLGAKVKAGYELAKAGSKAAKSVGGALEKGDVLKAAKEVQRSGPMLRQDFRNVRSMPSTANLDIAGLGGVGG